MEIVSLGLEDHGSRSHAALKSIIASSRVAAIIGQLRHPYRNRPEPAAIFRRSAHQGNGSLNAILLDGRSPFHGGFYGEA